MHVCQAEIATLETIRQLRVVNAEKVEDCGMQIVDMDFVFDCIESKVIGLTVDDSWFDAPASHPNGVAVWMMISTNLIRLGRTLHHRSSAKFTTPEHQCLIE